MKSKKKRTSEAEGEPIFEYETELQVILATSSMMVSKHPVREQSISINKTYRMYL